MVRYVGRALNVLLEEPSGLVAGEDPDPLPAGFCFFGVIPSFSFRAGERIEANDENILNVDLLFNSRKYFPVILVSSK